MMIQTMTAKTAPPPPPPPLDWALAAFGSAIVAMTAIQIAGTSTAPSPDCVRRRPSRRTLAAAVARTNNLPVPCIDVLPSFMTGCKPLNNRGESADAAHDVRARLGG